MIPRSRKIKKISYHLFPKRLIKYFRLALFLFTVAIYLFWSVRHSFAPPLPVDGQPLQIFAGQCDDNLCPLLRTAIASANHSILLIIYTLSEPKLIAALKERAQSGVQVKLVVDKGSPQKLADTPGIEVEVKDLNGLMHRKVLVVDEEKVFIGSANFTLDSLYLDDNLFASFSSKEFAHKIAKMERTHALLAGQRIDFYPLPEEKKVALQHLLQLLESAQKSIQVAMFTLTHPTLVEKLIVAHGRGLNVEVVVDRKSSEGASKKSVETLVSAGIPVSLNIGSGTLHHKLAVIDSKKVAFGSANWTKAAFGHNEECLVIVEEMNEDQVEKFKKLWHAIRCTSERVKRCSSSTKLSLIYDKAQANFHPTIFPIRICA